MFLIFYPSVTFENFNAFQKYAVSVPLPQPDIQSNSINFEQKLCKNFDLPSTFLLPTLGNTVNLNK